MAQVRALAQAQIIRTINIFVAENHTCCPFSSLFALYFSILLILFFLVPLFFVRFCTASFGLDI